MHTLCRICICSEQGMKGKEQKSQTQTAGTTWSCQSSTAAASQRGSACREEEEDINFRGTISVCNDFLSVFFFFLTVHPVVSLWKPGVPYPVHGRVLVEIQRPRSLHRKAVIQLNTKRNQHSQTPVHSKKQKDTLHFRKSNCRPLRKPMVTTTLDEANSPSEQLVYRYCSF